MRRARVGYFAGVDAVLCCLCRACVSNTHLEKCLFLFIVSVLLHFLSPLTVPLECLHESVKVPKYSKHTLHKQTHADMWDAPMRCQLYTQTYSLGAHRALSTLECMLTAEANRSCGVGVRPGNAGVNQNPGCTRGYPPGGSNPALVRNLT